MGSILDTFKDLAEGAMPGWRANQERKSNEIDAQRKRLAEDEEFSQHVMRIGALPVINGAVKRNLPLAGGGNIEGGLLDKAGQDGRPIIRHKTADGQTVQYELPTPEEQHMTQLKLLTSQFLNEKPMRQATADEAAANAGNLEASKQGGLFRAQNAERQANGLEAPDWVSRLVQGAGGRKYLPSELDPLMTAAGNAEQTQTKITQQKLAAASQALSAVTDQPSFDEWHKNHPEASQGTPTVYNPTVVKVLQRQAVPVEKQPEFDIKTKQADAMANLNEGTIGSQVDAIIPPKGATASLNQRTRAQVQTAMAHGADMQKIDGILKDASDQMGRVEVSKQEAANRQVILLGDLGRSTDDQPSETAKMVAEYQIPLSQATARMPPAYRDRLNKQILALNPQFQSSNYDTYKSTEKDATTGKIATSAGAINTALAHLTTLDQAADALKNGDIPALNRIANYFGVQTGGSAVTTYKTIVNRLGPEIAKAYISSGGSVGERGATEDDFNANMSPEQVKSNIRVSAGLFKGKVTQLKHQYEGGTFGRGKQQLLTPEAQATLDRFAGESGPKAPALPATLTAADKGKVYYSPKAGKNIRITDVNPANPKQFRSEDAP